MSGYSVSSSQFGDKNSSFVFNLNSQNNYKTFFQLTAPIYAHHFKINSTNTFLVRVPFVSSAYFVDLQESPKIVRDSIILAGAGQEIWYKLDNPNIQNFQIELYSNPSYPIDPEQLFYGTVEFK